jgi:thiol-disulfide isomerase/thioredoxin
MAPPAQPTNRKLVVLISAAVVAMVALAAVLALTLSGGDDEASGDSTDTTAEVVKAPNRPVAVSGTALPPLGDGGSDPALGLEAPVVEGADFGNQPVTVAADGRPTMLVFMAHWCPHCNRELPRLVEWKASGRVPADLQVIAVSTGVREDAPNYPPYTWLEKGKWTWPVLADSAQQEAAEAFGLDGFPYFVLLKPDGTVAARFSGEVETPALEQVLNQTLGLEFPAA